jgi:hypothetical protein
MPRVSLSEVEDALLEHPDPVVSAPELADELPCSRRHVADRLDLLEREDAVRSKKVGGRARVWWHTERVTPRRVPPAEDPDQSALRDHERRDSDHGAREPARDDEPEDGAGDDGLGDDLNALDLPGDGDRVDAVRAAFELLREQGTAEKSDFVSELFEGDHDAGYGSPGGWWNTVGKKGLRGLADRRDDVRAPPEGGRTWRFVGTDD